MIVYQTIIRRADLRANPGVLYVFGDNAQRYGNGGQAGHMRGEPNAVGVRTKHAPSSVPEAFFSDDTYDENIRMIAEDLSRMPWMARGSISAQILVVPAAGIGTGLSELPTRAPRTFEYLVGLGLGGVST